MDDLARHEVFFLHGVPPFIAPNNAQLVELGAPFEASLYGRLSSKSGTYYLTVPPENAEHAFSELNGFASPWTRGVLKISLRFQSSRPRGGTAAQCFASVDRLTDAIDPAYRYYPRSNGVRPLAPSLPRAVAVPALPFSTSTFSPSNDGRGAGTGAGTNEKNALAVAEKEVERQTINVQPVGYTREGHRDHVVLIDGYVPKEDAEAACPEAERLNHAVKIKSMLKPCAFPCSPSRPSHPVALKLKESLIQLKNGIIPFVPARPATNEAVSPTGWQLLAAVLGAVKTPGLADAMTDFLVDVCERSQEEQESSEDGGLAEAFDYVKKVILDEIKTNSSLTKKEIKEYAKRIISPAGSVFSPLGRASNYPPDSAANGEHKSGMNTSTWTGSMLHEKHGDIGGFFQDLLLVALRTGQKASIGPKVRTLPDKILDGEDGAGVELRGKIHRLCSDFGLVVLSRRFLSGTFTISAGPQASNACMNVYSALSSGGEWRCEIVSGSLAMFGASNDHGGYPDGNQNFEWRILYCMHGGNPVVGSVVASAAQWCAGRATSRFVNSTSAYRRAQLSDATEDIYTLLKTGMSSTSAARSNLAAAALPRDQSKGMHSTTFASLMSRQDMRNLEISSGIVFKLKEIPKHVVDIHLRQGDISSTLDPSTDHVGNKTLLEYLCSRSSKRAVETKRQQLFEVGGVVINGLQKLSREAVETMREQSFEVDGASMNGLELRGMNAAKTLRAKEVEYSGKVVTGTSARVLAQSETMRNTIVEDDMHGNITALQKRAYDALKTREEQTCEYEGETMTIAERALAKQNGHREKKMKTTVDVAGFKVNEMSAAQIKSTATRGHANWYEIAADAWARKEEYVVKKSDGARDLDYEAIVKDGIAAGKIPAGYDSKGKTGRLKGCKRYLCQKFAELNGKDWGTKI